MSRRHFSILLALALLAVLAVALLVPGKTGRESGTVSGEPLFPELGERINSATEVVVRQGPSEQVRLRLDDGRWQVVELEGFPADWARLRQLLSDVAQAEVLELKTDNPKYYQRLGVDDPEREGTSGILLEISLDNDSIALVVGNDADGRDGQFVRRQGNERSLLIDRSLDLPLDPVDWAERLIIDLPASLVAEVEIIHPDGDWVLARKTSADDADYTLESLPEGREVSSSWSVNSLGGVLASLRLEGVSRRSEPPQEAVRIRVLAFSGVEYMVQAWAEEEFHWVSLQASAPQAAPEDTSDVERQAMEELAAEAGQFNSRVEGWAFRVPEYKYSALAKRQEQLLKALEEGQDGS